MYYVVNGNIGDFSNYVVIIIIIIMTIILVKLFLLSRLRR